MSEHDKRDHVRFMNQAARIAREHMQAGAGGPFGAIVVREGAIIGRGWNRVTSANDPTAHAEISAIRDACTQLGVFSLERAVIYTSCEPCPMCLAAIWWARLATIYYTSTREDAARIGFDDAALYQEVGRALHQRQLPMVRCESDEAAQLMHEWLAKEDKIPY